MRLSVFTFGLFAVLANGCVSTLSPVVRGHAEPVRVVVLPARCMSVEDACPQHLEDDITKEVEFELGIEGYTVVDARELLAEARLQEQNAEAALLFNSTLWPATGNDRSNANLSTLSQAKRDALTSLGRADALLSIRVDIGESNSLGRRTNSVEIRLSDSTHDDYVWETRCTAMSDFKPSLKKALAGATLCALGGVVKSERTQNVKLRAQ